MPEDKKAESASSEESVVTSANLDSAAEEVAKKEESKPTDLGAETPPTENAGEKEGEQKSEELTATGTSEATTEPVETVVVPPGSVAKDNTESSRLGRKFVALEEENRVFKQRLEDIEKRSQEPIVEDDFVYPTTKEELRKEFLDFQKTEYDVKVKSQKNYESGYLQKLEDMSEGISPEDHKAVLDKMGADNSPFNKRYSNNSGYDAEKNFLKAQTSVLMERLKIATKNDPKNPLKGDTPPEALGVGGESKVESRKVKEVKLNKEDQAFKDSMGWDDAKVASAFEGDEMPSMQRGM